MKKKITSSDIARLAGVSQSTVSRALSPGKAWMISPEIRGEILKLCRKYDYAPKNSSSQKRRHKTFKIGFLLGSMEADLTASGFSFMLRELCDHLQSFNYTLTLIRVDYTSPKLAQNIKRILKSDNIDVYIAGAGLLQGQTVEFIRSMRSGLISYVPFCAPFATEYKNKNVSIATHDYDEAFRQFARTVPRHLLDSAIYLGNDMTDDWKYSTVKHALAQHHKKNFKIPFINIEVGLSLRDRAYRMIYSMFDKIYPVLENRKLFICGGSSIAQALSDYLCGKGLIADRDFFIVTFGIFSDLLSQYDYRGDPFSAFGYRTESAARRIAELALTLTENPVPQKIMIPVHFKPSPAFGGSVENLI